MADENDEEDDLQVERPAKTIRLYVHVVGEEGEKVIPVPCGAGPQTVKWLGHVGIARYDEEEYQGWVKLGVPTRVTNAKGEELKLDEVINQVAGLKSEDHVFVESSMFHVKDGGGGGGGGGRAARTRGRCREEVGRQVIAAVACLET